MSGVQQARVLAWLQPIQDHLSRASAAMQRGAYADAVAECDQALALLPEGHKLRADIQACRAMALAGLNGAGGMFLPRHDAAPRPPDTGGTPV